MEWDWNAEGGPPGVRATDTSEPQRWNWESSCRSLGALEAVRVKAGCLIDRRLAISRTTRLPQLSCSSNARKPLILLSSLT